MTNTSNTNPFLNPELINPKLTAELNNAFEKNKAKGLAKNSLGSLAVSNLADMVKEDTKTIKEQLSIHTGLDFDFNGAEDYLTNPEKVQQTFETAFADAEKLFRRIDLSLPTPEQFSEAGVNFLNLAIEYERMEKEGLDPAIVINPTLRIENTEDTIGPSWRGLYDKLTKDRTIKKNPLEKNSDGNGLWQDIGMFFEINNLFQQGLDLVTKNNNIHNITDPGNNLTWTIALAPSTDNPQEFNTLHVEHERPDTYSEHITISQYLVLQAIRIQSGLEPLDDYTYTRLQGTFESGSLAPYGYLIKDCGQVGVCCGNVNSQDGALGVRLPVWG